jgi:hypothetical protein
MLRNVLLALGGTLVAAGLVGIWGGIYAPSAVAIIWGGMMVFAIIYERTVYKTLVDQPPVGKYWIETTERFVDEKSGKTVKVYYNTLTGERSYVTS